jgi:iron complex transport system substrate-binding protein
LFPRLPKTARASLAVLLIAAASAVCSHAAEAGSPGFVDDLGRTVAVPHAPRRIISLAPSITETLFGIGLGDRVVGVTPYCDYPPEAKTRAKVGYMHPNLEAIVALTPDLVLAPSELLRDDVLAKLESLAIPTYVVDAPTIHSVLGHIRTFGRMLGASDSAEALADRMARQIDAIKARMTAAPRPRVLYVLHSDPLITAARGSFVHEAIELAGGSNVAAGAESAYPRLSMEVVVKGDPEIIIFPSTVTELALEGERRQWQRWSTLSAVRHGRFHRVPTDLLNRPGPRILQGVEALRRIFHPDGFEQQNGEEASGVRSR